MAQQVQLRRGTTTEISTFVGVEGEVVVDTTKDVLVVMDGVTAGGFPVAARANVDGTISLIKKDGTIAGTINSAGLFNNTLTSTNTNQALTAAQGKLLQDNKLNTTSAFGIGQTYQDVSASRTANTVYTNSTGKPILVCFFIVGTNGATATAYVGSVQVAKIENNSQYLNLSTMSFVVPVGGTYYISGNVSGSIWVELR